MRDSAFERILALSSSKTELEDSARYLSDHLRSAVRPGDVALICFPRTKQTDFGSIAGNAVRQCGGKPVFWENDLRWKELLRLAFVSRAATIIASPLIIIGLTKLAAYKNVPLYFRNAVMAGYPCLEWMMDGIEKGLDCRISGVFGPGRESAVGGFSCECGRGIHVRSDKYGVEIVDDKGMKLPDGQHGRIAVFHRAEPEARFITGSYGSLMMGPCPCGDPTPKIVDIDLGDSSASPLLKLSEELLYWNSVLECSIQKTDMGLELEVVCFPGEKLPKLPGCSKLQIRTWDPEKDIPMLISSNWIIE